MSHISKIELMISSLEDLKAACKSLGFQFVPDQKNFKWYGQWIGDTPLPEGVNLDDFGKCDHAIIVPECDYEVGVVRKDNYFMLLWDEWHRGGLLEKLGQNAGILKQAYAVTKIKREATLRNYRVREKRTQKGIRLVLSI
jgi:hypothetical protein